jgi:hypothetical protein
MRGGAQSHLMRCADGFYYVVKFQNNPQHARVLVNDWLGTRLAEMVGLPVPVAAVVNVQPWLLEHTPDLRIELCGHRTMFTPGLSFGSRYVVSPIEGQVYDYLPESMIARVRNLRDFAGILALDKWTCNANGRQAAFWKRVRERKFTASFIDQGYCFNAGEWNFPDAPLRGVFGRNDVHTFDAPAGTAFARPPVNRGFQEFISKPLPKLARGGELSLNHRDAETQRKREYSTAE